MDMAYSIFEKWKGKQVLILNVTFSGGLVTKYVYFLIPLKTKIAADK